MRPLRIAYLLEDTELAGGIRVAAAQADALIARGHDAVLVSKGRSLTWRRTNAAILHVDRFDEFDAREADFVVGTFFTTVPAAYALAGTRAVHLCPGAH